MRSDLASASLAVTREMHGCSVVLRRVDGPHAAELYLLCRPIDGPHDAAEQATAIYRSIRRILDDEGASLSHVVSETSFLANPERDRGVVRAARDQIHDDASLATSPNPARLEIGQPPLDARALVEVAVHAVVERAEESARRIVRAAPGCACAECENAHALHLEIGGQSQLHAAGLAGAGENAEAQTRSMFEHAERLLSAAGMSFHDVVRTWIHLRDIDRDYTSLNRARRAFFEQRGIDPVPASTGIGGTPAGGAHDLCLGFLATKGDPDPLTIVMTSPTLNEAGSYGADFTRGMRLEGTNRSGLYISGTASIDEAGQSAHPGNFEAQADRMLRNVEALLAGQGATFSDIVSGVTYLKRRTDAERLRETFRRAGFVGFPNALVEADVCRPELLCETEVLAIRRVSERSPRNG